MEWTKQKPKRQNFSLKFSTVIYKDQFNTKVTQTWRKFSRQACSWKTRALSTKFPFFSAGPRYSAVTDWHKHKTEFWICKSIFYCHRVLGIDLWKPIFSKCLQWFRPDLAIRHIPMEGQNFKVGFFYSENRFGFLSKKCQHKLSLLFLNSHGNMFKKGKNCQNGG